MITWTRVDVQMYGLCHRWVFSVSHIGQVHIDKHSVECRQECGSPTGWVLSCDSLGMLEQRIQSKSAKGAKAEALKMVRAVLRKTFGLLGSV